VEIGRKATLSSSPCPLRNEARKFHDDLKELLVTKKTMPAANDSLPHQLIAPPADRLVAMPADQLVAAQAECHWIIAAIAVAIPASILFENAPISTDAVDCLSFLKEGLSPAMAEEIFAETCNETWELQRKKKEDDGKKK
jgi:hypothetical protein